MSLTREHIQEDLSVAYISAVAAKAGFDCSIYGRHDYGVDLQVIPMDIDDDGERIVNGWPLLIQAKASQMVSKSDDYVLYNLKAKNYNKLVRNNKGLPYILVLYCMPSNENEWLTIDDSSTILKHKGYWISLKGRARTNNKQSIRIEIPHHQIFDEPALIDIMKTIQDRDP